VAYFGSSHTATVAEKADALFECTTCGLKKMARARALGVGAGTSPYFLDEGGATNRAMASASADAESNAELLLMLVPCPQCGARNPKGVSEFKKNTIKTTGMIVTGTLALAIFFAALGLQLAMAAALIGTFLGPLPYLIKRRNAWNDAGAAVTFFEGEPPDSPYLGKPCVVCTKKLLTKDDGFRCRLCGAAVHRKKCRKKHAAEKHDGETGT
jgi:predicted RNA-binding Zn-ribbon protein involved in translation (DUF1610 family)